MRLLLFLVATLAATAFSLSQLQPAAAAPDADSLRSALTFHATFDSHADADFARGDRRIYTAPTMKRADAKPGLHRPDIEIVQGKGKFGDALRFGKNDKAVVFYQADKNMAYRTKGWSGTVSFWLSLDPDKDLQPGFSDPIQITDKKWDDAAFFVDFTKDDKPRHFRLGVFGQLSKWNPTNAPADKYPAFNQRLVVVKRHPFAKGKWTHVAVTWSGLGSGKGTATLYVDGKSQGSSPSIAEPFEWDLSKGAIRLGVNYVGLFDDISLFRRGLDASEIEALGREK
jgi:hypothetical protein